MEMTYCGFESGSPFVVAYLFTPSGVHAYSGSWICVYETTKKLPTCHGITHSYNSEVAKTNAMYFGDRATEKIKKMWSKGIVSKCWKIFGKNRNRFSFVGTKRSCQKHIRNLRGGTMLIRSSGRKRLAINSSYAYEKGDVEIVRIFRKVPSSYMGKFFASIDKETENA